MINKRKQRGQSSNADRNPYMRDDYWAAGYFDFLWKPGISENYRARLNAIKLDAIRSNKSLHNRPAVRSMRFSGNSRPFEHH